MAENRMKLVADISTGEEAYIEMTSEEILDLEAQAEEAARVEAERISYVANIEALKASAKIKLTSVPPESLTSEEFDALYN